MNSHACVYCYDAGYIKCLFNSSAQNNPPTYEDEVTIQDILDFESIMGTRHDTACYSWKYSDAIPEGKPDVVAEQACSFRMHHDIVDITAHTLDGK